VGIPQSKSGSALTGSSRNTVQFANYASKFYQSGYRWVETDFLSGKSMTALMKAENGWEKVKEYLHSAECEPKKQLHGAGECRERS